MLFTEINFLYFFLPVWLAVVFANHYKWQQLKNYILFIAGFIFYGMFSPTYLCSLTYVIVINWAFAKCLLTHKKSFIVCLNVFLTLLPLLFYKYAHFFISDVLMLKDIWFNHIILPVGISFFTFQSLTHTIDIYRGKIDKLPSFLNYALFVSFFPTILSGPIERSRSLLPQIESLQRISLDKVMNGIQLIIWGLAKKLIVAERIAAYIDDIYATPELYGGNTIIYAMALYSVQIYCDFSGYSDIAVGIGRTMGFNLRKNFDFPYFSTTIRSFWKKWHISLTSWFTEYLYISMGGNRVMQWRWVLNVIIVFLVSGIWHGAAWTFIVWGLIHGVMQIIEHYTIGKHDYKNNVVRACQGILLFGVVTLAFVFFRADSLAHAFNILSAAARDWEPISMENSVASFILLNMAILGLILGDLLLKRRIVQITEIDDNPFRMQEISFMIISFLAVCLLSLSGSTFVYFQF